MESFIGTIFFVFVLLWAYRVEKNSTKSKEALERIEKLLTEKNKGEK